MKNKTQKKKSVSVYKRFQMYNIKKLIFNKLQTHLNSIFLEKQNSFFSPDGRENPFLPVFLTGKKIGMTAGRLFLIAKNWCS
jgi:hypothetical protein